MDEFWPDIDGQNVDSAFGKGAGKCHSKLAESNDESLFTHGISSGKVRSSNDDWLFGALPVIAWSAGCEQNKERKRTDASG